MRQKLSKDRTREVKRAAFVRGIARSLDMGASYSRTRIDTSVSASYLAIARDVSKIGRDMTKVIERTNPSRKNSSG